MGKLKHLSTLVLSVSLASVAGAQFALPQQPSQALILPAFNPVAVMPQTIQQGLSQFPINSPVRQALARLYARIGYRPLFVNGSSLTPLAMELRQSLSTVQQNGLPLGDYWSQQHEALYAQPTAIASALNAELLLAETYVAVGVHINIGRISPAEASRFNKIAPRAFTSIDVLVSGVTGSGIAATWNRLAPKAEGYQRLEMALASLQSPNNRNSGSGRKIKEIQLNMEKYRWIPNDPGQRYLLVNTAMQTLRLTDPQNTNPKLTEMHTINGKADHQTPSMSDNMASLDLNPPWHVTKNIFGKEKYPEILQVAQQAQATGNMQLLEQWFTDRNFVLIDKYSQIVDPASVVWETYQPYSGEVTLVERPGYMSSLGVVKFNLAHPPGPYYLHDTDTRDAFADQFRLLSHGCIRVQNPIDLAEYLLAGTGWDRQRIQDFVLKPGEIAPTIVAKSLAIPRPNQIPVYILNLTADVGLDGVLRFAKDSYGDTASLDSALRTAGYYQQSSVRATLASQP